MAKAKKATIKFQKNHLKTAIEQRRKKQKATQVYKKRNPQKFGRGATGSSANGDNEEAQGEDAEGEAEKNDSGDEKSADKSVDEFFNNDLDSDDEEPESDNEDFAGIDTIVEEDDGSDMDMPTPKKLTTAQKEKLAAKEEAANKIQLDALKEKDPEFYKYLQENDQELLDFDGEMEDLVSEEEDEDEQEDDEEEDEEMQGSDEEMEEPEPKKKSKKAKVEEEEEETMDGIPLVTKAMVDTWQSALVEKHSLRALRRLLLAFRAGAHLHDSDDDRSYAYKINSPVVFNKLVVTCLKHVIPTLDHHLPVQTTSGGKPKPVNSGSKYTTLQPLIKSFLQNTLHLLKELTDQEMIYFVIRESEKAIRYLVGFPKIAKDLLKHLLFLWSTATDRVRIISFLTIRTMCLQLGSNYLDLALKGVYLTFVRYAKTTTMHTLPNLHLMQNCVAQLYGMDYDRSYQHGFVYVRQLAIHLRNAVLVKTKESYKAVYNWQYLHCLGLWSQVVSTHALNTAGQPTALHTLIYPLVQVSLGALRLIPTSTYYPLRFQIIRNLIQLVENTGTFIPLAPFLFEVLEGGEMKRPGRKGTMKPLEWDLGFKCSNDYKGSRVYQDGTGEQVYELMTEYYALFSTSISFPELVIPAIVQLKRFIKKSSLVKLTKQFAGLVDKLEQNSRFVEMERNKADFSPSDAAGVSGFLRDQDKDKTPLGSYWKGVRRSVMAKRKMVEEARKDRAEREDKSSASRNNEDEDEDDESMDEDDLDEIEEEDDEDSECLLNNQTSYNLHRQTKESRPIEKRSSIPPRLFSKNYLHSSTCVATMTSIIYFIAYILIAPLSGWMFETKGIQPSLTLGGILQTLGCLLRLFAFYIPSTPHNPTGRIFLTLFGQAIAAEAQPFFLNVAPKYAAVWFAENERTTATMLGTIPNPLAAALAQLTISHITPEPDSMAFTLSISQDLSILAQCPVAWKSETPPLPPSPSAAEFALQATPEPFWLSLKKPYDYTTTEAGYFGAVIILAGLVGAMISAPVADRFKIYKLLCMTLVPMAAIMHLCLVFVIRRDALYKIVGVCILLGFASFAALPAALELAVEITYPVTPASSASILWAAGQALAIIFLTVAQTLHDLGPSRSRDLNPSLIFLAG
ncbi:hypothetical protein KVV02_001184, partial [Mortierella alpina]